MTHHTATDITGASTSSTVPIVSDADPSTVDSAEVLKALDVDATQGLSPDEAARRLREFGPNELASAPPTPKWKKFLLQFKDPLVYLLIIATIISLVAWFIERAQPQGTEEFLPFDAIVIVIILALNAVLGYLQEAKAEKAVDALAKMAAPTTSVLRNGQVERIATTEIVPGDILVLAEGDTVSADARLVAAASLHAAEASLTGESVPVNKKAVTLESAKALGDRLNMVFNGTAITQGTGRAVVTGTGMNTQVGKIAGMLSREKNEQTPLQKEMAGVSKALGIAVCGIAVLVLVALAFMQGFHSAQDIIDSLLLAVSLAVAAVPEGLATILTVVLALGVQRMAKHHAIVKKLSSVETLGSASVICSDKTGTLTRNEMTVERIVVAHRVGSTAAARVTGTGYKPVGDIEIDGANQLTYSDAATALQIGAFVNDAEFRLAARSADSEHVDGAADSEDSWEVVGDPTEISLLVAASKINDSVQPRFSRGAYARAAEIPFTSERKRMTVIASTHDADGNNASAWVLSKGAPDVLVRYCSQILDSGEIRDMTADDRFAITRSVEQLSSQAYRTLGMAFRPFDETDKNILDGGSGLGDGISSDIAENPDLIERDLIWAGMVGIIDPPRTEVRDSIAQAHSAGIRTIMITGDHPLTAAKIASDLGINDRVGDRITDRIDDRIGERINELSSPSSPQSPLPSSSLSDIVLTGDQLDELSEEELSQKVSEISVYARVAPEHKMMLVKTLQSQGNIVAMTGDGVNDAPAVKAADIGVAMGITGTEVTKEASEMILADDNFSTIVHAISEGRAIFDNIQKFLRFLLSSNAGEVCTVFAGVLLAGVLGLTVPGSTGITVPLLAVQLLWINLLTDAAPALAIGVDNQHIDIMSRRPRKLTDRVIDKEMWIDIIFVGIIMAAVTLIGMDMHLAGGLFTDRSTSNLDHIHQITEARTMGFTILVFAQLFNALASRSATVSAFKDFFQNRMLWLSIGISVVLQVIVIYIPILNEAFGTTPLGWQAWLECIALASVVLWATELRKLWLRASARRRARA